MSLLDANGERIRGRDDRERAEQAPARLRLSGELHGQAPTIDENWIVARACSD